MKEKIEMIINRLLKDKDFETYLLKSHKHHLEDAYADNQKFAIQYWSEKCEEKETEIKAINEMIDFMKEQSCKEEAPKKYWKVTKHSYLDAFMDGRLWDSTRVYSYSTFELAKKKYDELKEKAIAEANKNLKEFETEEDVFSTTIEFELEYIDKWDTEIVNITITEDIMDQLDDKKQEAQ